jgi:hypothetical protein
MDQDGFGCSGSSVVAERLLSAPPTETMSTSAYKVGGQSESIKHFRVARRAEELRFCE